MKVLKPKFGFSRRMLVIGFVFDQYGYDRFMVTDIWIYPFFGFYINIEFVSVRSNDRDD